MITELTKEQKDKLIDYGLKWTSVGLSTEPVSLPIAIEAVKNAYRYAGVKPIPKIYLGPFDNPVDCAKAQIMFKRMPADTDLSKLKYIDIPEGEEFTAEELYDAIEDQVYGFHESSWLCYYEFIKNELDVPELEALDGLMDAAEELGWWAPYDKVVFIQNRPAEIHLDEEGRLHNDNGPALKWRGDNRAYDIYAIHGELQPSK
jgi:hypothetical protein